MVAQGYWLRAKGQPWRRVRIEDYEAAAAAAGFDGQAVLRDFRDAIHEVSGTTIDPNRNPREQPRMSVAGRPVIRPVDPANLEDRDRAFLTLAAAFQHLGEVARTMVEALLPSLTAISQILEAERMRIEQAYLEITAKLGDLDTTGLEENDGQPSQTPETDPDRGSQPG